MQKIILHRGVCIFFTQKELPSDQKIVQLFVDTHYPALDLDEHMMQQLLWLQNNSVVTSQSHIHAPIDSVNIEVKRILSRLYTLTLLKEGGVEAYSAFISVQAHEIRLQESTFNQLSAFIQALGPAAYEAVIATCFITKSTQAIQSIPEEQRSLVPSDSEQFITHMVTDFPHVFSICASLSPDAIALLPFAFYKNSHARQMLDMEGGYNMTAHLTEAIQTNQITREQYNLWFVRWIINIAGLDGHVAYNGSSYLTEPVGQCILALKLELDELWSNPAHPVIDNYLAFREKQLNVKGKYVAYLGALMREYSPQKGQEIETWFETLDEHEQEKKLEELKRKLEKTIVTPTFKPIVLVNLMKLGCSVSEALTLFTEIESQAMQIYAAAVEEGRISDSTPLSYRDVAFREYLLPIKAYYDRNQQLPEFSMNSGGYLMVTADALEEENTLRSAAI